MVYEVLTAGEDCAKTGILRPGDLNGDVFGVVGFSFSRGGSGALRSGEGANPEDEVWPFESFLAVCCPPSRPRLFFDLIRFFALLEFGICCTSEISSSGRRGGSGGGTFCAQVGTTNGPLRTEVVVVQEALKYATCGEDAGGSGNKFDRGGAAENN